VHGYHGRYLRFDLSTGTGRAVPLSPATLRRYVGGVGLGAWILHHEAPPGVDPLAPEAPLVFCFSPLVGTPLTTSAKFAVVAKSPLTGMLCDALSCATAGASRASAWRASTSCRTPPFPTTDATRGAAVSAR
jgi:aldehyde:ferredoxin oxidoreductase